jgi:biopolymer transport protein ExbD
MRFFTRKKHQPPAVIIVALIDVLIVVMIFLMVTTTFKKPQASVQLALPESSQSKRTGASDNPPLIVFIEATGTMRWGPQAKPVTQEDLKNLLRDEFAKNPQLKLAISADDKAPFGRALHVYDAAKEAGIKSIMVYTKPLVKH